MQRSLIILLLCILEYVCIQRVAKLVFGYFSVYSRKRDKPLIDRTGWHII